MQTSVLLLASALLPCAASAADLVNQDNQGYEIKIHDAGTIHSSIAGNTTRVGVCGSCRIEVSGVGEIEVESGDNRVIIKDRALSKE